jgi:hypothetical protein
MLQQLVVEIYEDLRQFVVNHNSEPRLDTGAFVSPRSGSICDTLVAGIP